MRICIYTQESVEGKMAVPIKEDRIIRGIRAVKQLFGVAQMNELYVSQEHLEEHKKRRSSFEKSMLFASVIAGLIVILAIFSIVVNGRFELWAIVSAFLIGGFILFLPIFKYSPALESETPAMVGSGQKAVAPAKEEKPKPKKKAPKKKRASKKR